MTVDSAYQPQHVEAREKRAHHQTGDNFNADPLANEFQTTKPAEHRAVFAAAGAAAMPKSFGDFALTDNHGNNQANAMEPRMVTAQKMDKASGSADKVENMGAFGTHQGKFDFTLNSLKGFDSKANERLEKAADQSSKFKGEGPHLDNSLTDRVIKAIGANEGKLSTFTPNDAGHGIAIGIRQWNQKRGELPDLLKSWHDTNPEKFDKIFGKYSNKMLYEHSVRRANIACNRDLTNRFKEALKDPEFQQVQIDKAREFVGKSIETARKFGLKSELGAALVADIRNQMGNGGANKVLKRLGLTPGGEVQDEGKVLARLQHMRRPNARDRYDQLASNFTPEKRPDRIHMDDTRSYSMA